MIRRRPSISKRGPLALVAWGILLGRAALPAAEGDPGKVLHAFQQQARAVFEKCGAAVVRIEASDAHGRLAGTGFFIDPNGTLCTAYSVGGEGRDITVEFRGEKHPATRLISDARSGIAILKIDAETPFLTAGKTRELAITSPVIALGYPQALPLTPSFGIVGGFDIKYGGRYFATTHIRANPAWAALPVLALSASVLPEDRARAARAGVNGHIAKPLLTHDLMAALLQWVPVGQRTVRSG